MEIGDWRATPVMGPLYKTIRELGLEQNVAELDAFGYTILPPGKAAPVEFTDRMREQEKGSGPIIPLLSVVPLVSI